MSVGSDLSCAESLSRAHRRAFNEGYRSLALFMILIVFLAPFAAFYFTPYIWLKLVG